MPMRVPSFPCPGAHKRISEEDPDCPADGKDVEDGDAEEDAEDGGASEPPELLELIELLEGEEVRREPSQLAHTIHTIGKRIRLSPGDRDMLSDFEGVNYICGALATPPISWQGEPMLALCRALPDICRTSNVNRSAFRDGGAVDALVGFLRASLAGIDEAFIAAASIGLTALCTANDGNKKAAAQLRGEFNEEELVDTNADFRTPLFKNPSQAGALDLLLEALSSLPSSVLVQTHACACLRTLLSDDDTRQASCVPSAVENRERAVNDEHFPAYKMAAERALACSFGTDGTQLSTPLLRLREQALLLLREISCRQDRIHELVFGAGLLPTIEASLKLGDERIVRASLAVIRAFAFSDELKEQLAVESDVVLRCVTAVHQHVTCPAICEQGFGLFANVTMRKPHIAARLNGPDIRVLAVGQLVLSHHRGKPNVVRSVYQTMRNVATQDEAAALEVKESDLLEEMRKLVVEREGDAKWRSSVEIAKQCLREFRADEGLRKAAQYNEFY